MGHSAQWVVLLIVHLGTVLLVTDSSSILVVYLSKTFECFFIFPPLVSNYTLGFKVDTQDPAVCATVPGLL